MDFIVNVIIGFVLWPACQAATRNMTVVYY
jgi:hypothetical protein